MQPVDVLQVTGGQDHGARFGLRGSSATIGRGPVMDVVLTDPRVSRRHARVRVDGARLLVEDLASTGGTAVNGATIAEPTALAAGDRLTLGGTELTVLWTPTGSLAPAAREEPAPALARPAPPPRPSPTPHRDPAPAAPAADPPMARPGALLPAACLVLAGFALLATWMPALADASGTDSLWSLEPSGLRLQAISAALLTGLTAGLWLSRVHVGPRVAPSAALAGATAIGGGLVAGLPLFLAALDLPGVSSRAGLGLLALAGIAIAACALAGLLLDRAAAAPRTPDPAGVLVLAGGGAAGSLLAAAACPLTWVSTGGTGIGGLSDGLAAGGWLLPLCLAVAAGCALTVAVARAGGDRRAVHLAVGTTVLAAAAATFATGAAIGLRGYRMEAGLSLALAGTAVAAVSTVIGTGTLLLGTPEDTAAT